MTAAYEEYTMSQQKYQSGGGKIYFAVSCGILKSKG